MSEKREVFGGFWKGIRESGYLRESRHGKVGTWREEIEVRITREIRRAEPGFTREEV